MVTPTDAPGAAGWGWRPDLRRSVVRIRGPSGKVAGTGFVVGDRLVVTCAHVVAVDGAPPREPVSVEVLQQAGAVFQAHVDSVCWRGPDRDDVAFLRCDGPLPESVGPLPLGAAEGVHGHRVASFGFPANAPSDGHYGYGRAGGEVRGDSGSRLVQVTECREVTEGFSGGPVLDEVTGLVIGMVDSVAIADRLGRGGLTAYVTPTETLRAICPDLTLSAVCPYVGLDPFTGEHAEWFFGRERAIDAVLARLRQDPRMVALVGPSGSGKSSLVNAGVLPALERGDVPGSDRWGAIFKVSTDLPDGPMAAMAISWLAAHADRSRVVLVLDQFEQLLVTTDPARRAAALAELAELPDRQREPTVSVIVVMRDDFYSRLAAAAPPLMRRLEGAVVNIPAVLEREELTAIIKGPAEAVGLGLEPQLTDRIVNDALAAAPPGAPGLAGAATTVLPLVEFTLTELWHRRDDGRLTHRAYANLGGVTGGLAGWCERTYRSLPAPLQPVTQRVLTALIEPADETTGTPPVSRRRTVAELKEISPTYRPEPASSALEATPGQDVDEVLARLADARLIVTRHEPTTGEGTAELIHDTLIREWARLREWLEQDREFLIWHTWVEDQYQRWYQTGDTAASRDGDMLLRGSALNRAIEWCATRHVRADIRHFVDHSSQAEQRRRIRTRHRIQLLAGLLILTLTLGVIAAVFAYRADRQAQIATSWALAAESDTLLNSNPDMASLLAIHAYRVSPTDEAAASLIAAAALPLQHTLPGQAPVFSPDGALLATRVDQYVMLWETATGRLANVLDVGHPEIKPVRPFSISPDNTLVALPLLDGTVELWDTGTGEQVRTLTSDTPQSVSWPAPPPVFSPDGTLIANANFDSTVHVWDIATGRGPSIPDIPGHAVSMAFSPDSTTLATGSDDWGGGAVRLWDAHTGEPAGQPPFGDTGKVWSTVFSANGSTLATATIDDTGVTVRLWDRTTGETETTSVGLAGLHGLDDYVTLSPDLRTFATRNLDGSVQLLDVTTGVVLATLPGEPSPFRDPDGGFRQVPVFSPDGTTLTNPSNPQRIVDADGRYQEEEVVRVWDVPRGTQLVGQSHVLTSVVFGADDTTLAAIGFDLSEADPPEVERVTINLWDTITGELIDHDFPETPAMVLLESPVLLIATSDGRVQLWDISTGQPIVHRLASDAVPVGISPDGTTVATLSSTGKVDLWDIDTGNHQVAIHAEGRDWQLSHPLVFSLDGNTLATADSKGTLWTWNVATGELRQAIVTGSDRITGAALNPDGTTVASTSIDGVVQIWDTTTGAPVRTLLGHNGPVTSAAFNPDGTTLATGGQDGTVRLWDIRTGLTLTTFVHADPVSSMAFSSDGPTLVTTTIDPIFFLPNADPDGPVRPSRAHLWDVSLNAPADAIRKICRVHAGHSLLTPQERNQYLPPEQANEPVCHSGTTGPTSPPDGTPAVAAVTPTPADPAAAAERAALETYRGMWDAYIQAGRPPMPNPDDQVLQLFATADALQMLALDLTSMREQGLAIEGSPVLSPQVTKVTPASSPTRALVMDCADTTVMRPVGANGTPVGDETIRNETLAQLPIARERVLVVAELANTTEGWKVTSIALVGWC